MVKKTQDHWTAVGNFSKYVEMYNVGEEKRTRDLWINNHWIMTSYRDGDDTIIVFHNGNGVKVQTPNG